MFKRRFQCGLCRNQVKYARITITHVCFIALTLAGSLGRCLNTRPNGLVFKQLPRDPANVNEWKNMCDPYSGLQILLHGVISLPDATSYDNWSYRVITFTKLFCIHTAGFREDFLNLLYHPMPCLCQIRSRAVLLLWIIRVIYVLCF